MDFHEWLESKEDQYNTYTKVGLAAAAFEAGKKDTAKEMADIKSRLKKLEHKLNLWPHSTKQNNSGL